jgi:hypothetical protein
VRAVQVLAGLAAVTFVACGSSPDRQVATSSTVPTFEVYESAVFRFRDCMQSEGYPLDGLGRSASLPELFEWRLDGEAVDLGVEDRCYQESGLALVEPAWNEDVLRRNPEKDQTYQLVRSCAQVLGLDAPADATSAELVDAIWKAGRDPIECLEIVG